MIEFRTLNGKYYKLSNTNNITLKEKTTSYLAKKEPILIRITTYYVIINKIEQRLISQMTYHYLLNLQYESVSHVRYLDYK